MWTEELPLSSPRSLLQGSSTLLPVARHLLLPRSSSPRPPPLIVSQVVQQMMNIANMFLELVEEIPSNQSDVSFWMPGSSFPWPACCLKWLHWLCKMARTHQRTMSNAALQEFNDKALFLRGTLGGRLTSHELSKLIC